MDSNDPKLLAELLQKARTGNSRALEKLCRALEQYIRKYFETRFTDKDVVDDLCQESYIRLLDSILQVRDQMKLRSFVSKITFYVMQDHLRKQYKSREDTIENFEDYYVDQDDGGHENEDAPILDRIDLNEAMATFPAKSKEILSMKAQGYNYEEIAQQTGLSVSGVKMQVKRSIEQLRTILLSILGGW